MKVWITTSGAYSSYDVTGVFSTLEAANKFTKEFFPNDGNDPLELEVDGMRSWKPSQVEYRVALLLEDGNLFKEWTNEADSDGALGWSHFYEHSPGLAEDTVVEGVLVKAWKSDPDFCLGVSRVSREHALKLAAENRQEVLRARTIKPCVSV